MAITWVCMCPDEPVMKVPHRQTLEAREIVRCTVSARCSKPFKAPSDELAEVLEEDELSTPTTQDIPWDHRSG